MTTLTWGLSSIQTLNFTPFIQLLTCHQIYYNVKALKPTLNLKYVQIDAYLKNALSSESDADVGAKRCNLRAIV